MNPIIAAGVAGAAGLGYLAYRKFKKPEPVFQSMNGTDPGGAPVKVATPISESVTPAQQTGTPSGVQIMWPSGHFPGSYPYPPGYYGPPTIPQSHPPRQRTHVIQRTIYHPVPTTVPRQGMFYAPPGTITVAEHGGIYQPAPIVITKHGSASIAVGTVKNVQHALNTLGHANPPLAEDGKLGPKTINAIKTFQSRNGLVVDGNASGATKAALSAALTHTAGGGSVIGTMVHNSKPESGTVKHPSGAIISTAPALNMGGKDVQHSLNVMGASPPLAEDGKMGPKTVAAIKSFQTVHGLTPDGVAGPKTKTALHLASSATPAPIATTSFYANPQTSHY